MKTSGQPTLTCGEVSNVHLSNELTEKDRPITLATVQVHTDKIKRPCVLINSSSLQEIITFGSNPTLSLVFRLVRFSHRIQKRKILEEWTLSAAELLPTPIEVDTLSIQPLVLNFCDCLNEGHDTSFTYLLQLAAVDLNNIKVDITNQEFSAIVSPGESEQNL